MRFADGLLRCTVDWRTPPAHFPGSHFLMNQGLLKLILDWLPFLFFVAVLIFFMRKTVPRQRNYMQSSQQYMSDHLAEVRRMNETLARIADALESRSSKDR